jgi:hypothetical protein
MAAKHIVVPALVLAILGGAWWIVLGGSGDTTPPTGPSTTASEAGAVAGPAASSKTTEVEEPGEIKVPGPRPAAAKASGGSAPAGIARTGKPPKGAAVFPDGTWMPPINGVTFVSTPCPWPDYVPYAPIVEVVTGDKGIQWWKHADGTISNTQIVQRTEGDRTWSEVGWAVGNPTKTLPVDIGSGGAGSGSKPPIRIGN